MLDRYAGLGTLAVFSAGIVVALGMLWRLTGMRFFHRWARRLSLLLSLQFCVAYLTRNVSLDPRTVHTLGDYNLFITRSLMRDNEYLSAHFMPHLAGIICTLAGFRPLGGWLKRKLGSKLQNLIISA